ncbi:MAG: DUF368 domain-containing protein [Planctomycetes bacterium]|nr:DUF368 domain-containing protein [Planctomycetota bacterium]
MARRDVLQVVRGFLMGGADIVPGVSGGTVALILGIYERLVLSISRFDTTLVALLRRGRLRAAAEHVDLRFLAFLLLGIATGITSLAAAMHHLLLHHHERTLAAFFGMIVASTWLVARLIDRVSLTAVVGIGAGFAFAWWLVGLPFLADPPDHPAYLFACGAVAICAMILPGISGAFVLLILGKYFHVTGIVKGLPHGEITGRDLLDVAAFALGAITGILSFSRLLRFLLARFHAPTMAVLAGFMLGSLRRIWPFQTDLSPDVDKLQLKLYVNRNPDWTAGATWLTLLVAVLAAGFVLTLEIVSTRASRRAAATHAAVHPEG